MKRILLMVIKNIVLVPWMWIKLCYHAKHTEKYTEEEQYKMLRFITLHANKVVMLKSTCMARRIFLKIMGLCFSQITRVFMMFWQLLKRVPGRFL